MPGALDPPSAPLNPVLQVSSSGLRVEGLGFKVEGFWFKVERFRVWWLKPVA